MIIEVRNGVVRNAIWFTGLGAALIALLGGTTWFLLQEQAEVRSMQVEVQRKRAELTDAPSSVRSEEALARTAAEVLTWSKMIDSEPRRIAALAAAARAAGVTIVSLESSRQAPAGDARLASCSHALQSVGNYAQLASFLDQVYATEGMATIEQLDIGTDNDLAPGLLRASLRVTWYAPGEDTETTMTKEKG